MTSDEDATPDYEHLHRYTPFLVQPSATDLIERVRTVVASLGLPPLTEEIFSRRGWLPLAACVTVRARLYPDAPAVVAVSRDGDEKVWTWSEFDDAIHAASTWLADRGVQPGTSVAIALPNGARHIIATQAAWRLGATVVPVDPSLPAAPRAELLERLTPVTLVDSWPDAMPTGTSRATLRLADPHSILPTGGTLGQPRLAVQRGSLWGRLDGPPERLRDGYGLADRQIQLVTLPLHHGFGYGFAHQYGLAFGHCLVIQERLDAQNALKLIERWQVEFLATVPTVLGRLARSPAFASADLSSIEALLHGAAPCPAHVKRLWMDRLGPQRVFEAYGATEISLDCTIRGDEWLRRPGSVGRPVGGVIEIRSSNRATHSSKEVGEILVRPVERGAAHPDLIGAKAAGRREARPTGDIGYLDDEGYLYVVGRGALQLVSGGVTVYVEEVEATLAAHPDVLDAAVVPVQHSDLGEIPQALVCLESTALAGPKELVTWCRTHLAPPQVPRTIQIVTDLPRTAVGKLDRARLRTVGLDGETSAPEYAERHFDLDAATDER